MALSHVYVVIEYGEEFQGSYENAYTSFQQARNALLTKHFEKLRSELEEGGFGTPANLESLDTALATAATAGSGGSIIPAEEDASGKTEFHIESGGHIRIEIVKLAILYQTGGRRRKTRKNRMINRRRAMA